MLTQRVVFNNPCTPQGGWKEIFTQQMILAYLNQRSPPRSSTPEYALGTL